MSYNIKQLQELADSAAQVNAAKIVDQIKFKLNWSVSEGRSFRFVYPILEIAGSGRLSFDGRLEHLSGEALYVYRELARLGLNPRLAANNPWQGRWQNLPTNLQFLERASNAAWHWIAVSWPQRPKGFGDDSFVSQLCERTSKAVDKQFQDLKERIPIQIGEAASAGFSWTQITKVFANNSITELNGFNGTKESLTGLGRKVFEYLADNKLQPRLLKVPGTLSLDDAVTLEGNWYHIIAQWHKEPDAGQY